MQSSSGKKVILMTGVQPYNLPIGSNFRDIAHTLAKEHTVIWVDNSPGLKQFVQRKRKTGLHQLGDSLWAYLPKFPMLPANKIPFSKLHECVILWNSHGFALELQSTILKKFNQIDIWLCDSDLFRSSQLHKYLPSACKRVLYYRDFLMGVPFWQKHGKLFEQRLAQTMDLVCANSTYLQEYLRTFNSNAYFIGQGSPEAVLLEEAVEQAQAHIREIQGVKIGYVGNLTSTRLDIPLLENVARVLVDYQFILVGPEDENFQKSKLHSMPNVHFLGRQHPDFLYGYIHAFDVCINPQLVNAITIGNYPRKVDEYLRLGKPTVVRSTPTMDIFKNTVYCADTADQYIEAIELAIQEQSEDRIVERLRLANSHSWEASVEALFFAIEGKQYVW